MEDIRKKFVHNARILWCLRDAIKILIPLNGEGREVDLLVRMNRGEAQRVYYIVKLSMRFPELGIIEKCYSGEIQLCKIRKEVLRVLYKMNAHQTRVMQYFAFQI